MCNKERDLATGRITKLDMSADVTGLNLFVLDDICDGGRTFIELAKLVTKANKVELAVTHGLFTKGIDVVANEFDRVYTTTSYTGTVPELPNNMKVTYYVW
ncbi:phosphoribosylpyrophosphate synthetase [compost metagenome]